MVRRIAWIERKFSFDFPVGMFPNILERVRGTPARLEDLTRSLSKEILTRRDGKRWSIQEHAGHLLDLGALDLGRLDDFEAGRETLRAADMENRRTYEADHNRGQMADILKAFRAERAEFVRRLEEYDEEFVARAALHPRLKIRMRVVDLCFFISEHDDHHLSSIRELIGLFGR
ncbi:MAG TPA: DinB family protein [Pyrinomonadaceae bacterium]|jgi:hypothetical protein